MQRILLAVIGGSLAILGGWFSFVSGPVDFGSIMFRSGLVISALALALPQITQFFAWFPPWLLAAGAVGFFIMLRWPKTALVVVPIFVALWFLGPRAAKSAAPTKLRSKRPLRGEK
jgi:hypothetical protein